MGPQFAPRGIQPLDAPGVGVAPIPNGTGASADRADGGALSAGEARTGSEAARGRLLKVVPAMSPRGLAGAFRSVAGAAAPPGRGTPFSDAGPLPRRPTRLVRTVFSARGLTAD
jgi:hypothetical protein